MLVPIRMKGAGTDMTVTISLRVYERDITVELEPDESDSAVMWHVKQALDEAGRKVLLTKSQKAEAIRLAGAGVDETGR